MSVDDAMARTKILFAETGDLTADPATPDGLKAIRDQLGALIKESTDGVGFARPREPTVGDLAQPAVLAAWQASASSAASPPAPARIGNKSANVAIFSTGDPLVDTNLTQSLPWLSVAEPPQLSGRAKRGNLDLGLYLTSAPDGVTPGRYPRLASDVRPGATAPWTPGFKTRAGGAIWFLAVLVVLVGSAVWAGFVAHDSASAESSAIAVAATAERVAFSAVEAARTADNTARTTETATALQTAMTDYDDAATRLAGLRGGYRSIALLWIAGTVGLFALMGLVGWGLRREVLGFLVDERGRLSLSRFQFVAWTLTILGGYWIAAAWNIGLGIRGGSNTVALPQMGPDLWILLGISTASPLLSGLILNVRRSGTSDATPAADDAAGAQPPPFVPAAAVGNAGPVDIRTEPGAWSFLDLFVGEEVTTRSAVDISRVQQFVFTAVALFAYVALLATAFAQVLPGVEIRAMPEISLYLVGLLAISHAGYLAAKAIPKS